MAENYLKTKDSAKLTVQQMRRMVRQQIEEVRRIEYDLDETKKSGYLRRIISDIKSSGHVNVSKSDTILKTQVKYMRKKQLQTLYNELQGVINADRESLRYARHQANRKDQMRRKTNKSLTVNLTKEQYDIWLDIWDEYEPYMKQYGYSEIAELIASKENKGKSGKEIIEDLIQAKEELAGMGVTPEPEKVLLYLKNKNQISEIMQQDQNLSIEEAIERMSTHK